MKHVISSTANLAATPVLSETFGEGLPTIGFGLVWLPERNPYRNFCLTQQDHPSDALEARSFQPVVIHAGGQPSSPIVLP